MNEFNNSTPRSLDYEITELDVRAAEVDLLSFLVFHEEEVIQNVSINNLNSKWFITPAAKAIFLAIDDLKLQKIVVNRTNIFNYLQGKYALTNPVLQQANNYLLQLEEKFDFFKTDDQVQILQNFHIKLELNALAKKVLDTKPSTNQFNTKLQTWHQLFFDIISKQEFKRYLLAEEVVQEYQHLVDQASKHEMISERFFKTEFPFLDDKIKGLIGGQLLILAARPGVGKTTFALNVISRNLDKLKINPNSIKLQPAIGIFSLEMTKESLLEKIIAINGQIDINEVKKPLEGRIVESGHTLREIEKQKKLISNSNLLFCDQANVTIGEIQGMIKTWTLNYDLKVVIIDYLQLININHDQPGLGFNQQLKIATISRTLKLICNELNIPIIALAQLNRKSEERKNEGSEPLLSDLRESGSIEQDADIVMFLYQDSKKKLVDGIEVEDDYKITDVILKIGKNRHGEMGKVNFTFNKTKGQFELQSRLSD